MSLQREDVDKLLAPEIVDGLSECDLGEIRDRRDACKRVEDMVSYLRRIVQGQIDLVTAETSAREGGAGGDVSTLVENLAGILAGPPNGTGLSNRPVVSMHTAMAEMFEKPSDLTPDEIAAVLSPELAAALLPGGAVPVANLGAFSDIELAGLCTKLGDQEQALSEERRILHDRIDLLQAAIVERYKSGAADIDSLLGSHKDIDATERDADDSAGGGESP